MFHPNSNSKYRGVKNLICNNLLRKYRHGIPPETQHYEHDGHPLSDRFLIFTEDGLALNNKKAIPIKGPNNERAKVVAHFGQSSSMGAYIIQGYS